MQLAAGEFAAAALPGARSPISGAGRALIDATPGPVVDVTVATAQRFDKHILRASLVTGLLGAGVLSCSPVLTRNRGAGLLGVIGGAMSLRKLGSPASTASKAAMVVLSLVFVVLCVRSFIAARKARQAAAA